MGERGARRAFFGNYGNVLVSLAENSRARLRHPLESHCTVGVLFATILNESATRRNRKDKREPGVPALTSENGEEG